MRIRALLPVPAVAFAAVTLLACGGGDGTVGSGTMGPSTAGGEGGAEAKSEAQEAGAGREAGVLAHTLPLLDGTPKDLASYRGKVVLVVNTASECGFAPQFGGLERLYRARRADGLVVLGFPADDVVGQEPRSDEEIAEFCRANYGVTFPMFAKSNVVDEPVNPLFSDLAAELGEPTYNFNKYLLDRRGRAVERFDQSTEPDDPELTAAIARELSSG